MRENKQETFDGFSCLCLAIALGSLLIWFCDLQLQKESANRIDRLMRGVPFQAND